MLHRVFLAINPPQEIKEKLFSFREKWLDLPFKWTKKENLHLTLLFIGALNDNQLKETVSSAQGVSLRHSPFIIRFEKNCFGPDKKFPPRFIWAQGEKSQELANLQADLEESIYKNPGYKYKSREIQPHKPHITLARIKQWDFRRLEEIPPIEESINLDFEASSFDLMESYLKRGGAKYEVLESFRLKSN